MTGALAQSEESWGQMGVAMKALPNDRYRAFVHALVTGKPGYGALSRAYRSSGFRCREPAKQAYKMMRDPRVIEAIVEEGKKVVRGIGYAEAITALLHMVRSPGPDRMRAVAAILDRIDPMVSKQLIDVTHRQIDPDQEAIEELRALRQLNTPHEKLLELYGGNQLARLLERLEAADIARRAENAKIINGTAVEASAE